MPYFAPSPFDPQSGLPDLASATGMPAQLVPPATAAPNLLDLWSMGNAASNDLNPFGVAGPASLGDLGFPAPAPTEGMLPLAIAYGGLGCNDAFMQCYNANPNSSAWKNQCAVSLQACLTHGLPTIFPGRIWGQR